MTEEERIAALRQIIAPKPLPTDRPVVITSGPLLGLGDTAIYSTLPERFTKLGYEVYYDEDNASSNPEIFDLFWRRNPFLRGPSNLKPNAGYVRQGAFYELANRLPGCRSIEAMERAHALPPPYGMAPKIYYEPKKPWNDVSETIIVDFSAVSSTINRDRMQDQLQMMNERFKNPDPAKFLQIIHTPWVAAVQERIIDGEYMVRSIDEYLDILFACRAWVGSEAGGQSLASAVRGEFSVYDEEARPEVVCVINKRTFNNRGYCYANVDYRMTSKEPEKDYFFPHEVVNKGYEDQCQIRKIGMAERLERHG